MRANGVVAAESQTRRTLSYHTPRHASLIGIQQGLPKADWDNTVGLMPENHPEQITLERFAVLVEAVLRQARPNWSKLAIARVLHLVFPDIGSRDWLLYLEHPDRFLEAFSPSDAPSILGRLARASAEIKKLGYENFPFLQKVPWILNMKIEADGSVAPEGGIGLNEIVKFELGKTLQQTPETQTHFWSSFAKAFARDLKLRRQDMRALAIYIFLAMSWQEVEGCKSIRELYTFVFSKIPKEACRPNMDPIDFEERHFKWFEKLCHRNLRLSLGKRGRPRG